MARFNYEEEPLRDIFFIDVKSFYASVECVQRGLDPLTTMLVVMAQGDNTGNGLVLAASPMAKKVLGITNVTRADNLPNHPNLYKVSPRMNLYIQENLKVNNVYRTYVADEDLLLYSIDESVMDVTQTLNLFFPDPTLTRSQKRHRLAKKIKDHVFQATGLRVTVGIGDNPLLAKLAMDIEAKKNPGFMAEWTYQDVESKVWKISQITDFWGIGSRTKKRLAHLGIETIKELAQADPDFLHSRMGIIGEQLYHHANGIDRTILAEPTPKTREKSYGNSQVLNRNYYLQSEIELVVKEMAEQVATRIRRERCQTQCIHLYIGVAFGETQKGFAHQMKIPATDNTKQLIAHALFLFRKYYTGQVIRHIGITYSKLIFTQSVQLDLFQDPEEQLKQRKLDLLIDKIRAKYGFTAIVHAASTLEGGRAIARANLVGGHAGGMSGIEGKQAVKNKRK
jgi:DNA polymerase V